MVPSVPRRSCAGRPGSARNHAWLSGLGQGTLKPAATAPALLSPPPMELALIDAIGPFFRGYDKRRINWSKIPFLHLATEGPERATQWAGIRADLDRFAQRVAALGYNAVSLDDLAHLTDHP